MQIKFKVCSCQKDKIHLWEKFSQNLENILKKEVKVSIFERFPQDLEQKIDLFYSSFSLSIDLIKKNYRPLAKFKNQFDYYLVLSRDSLQDLKNKERIKVIMLKRSIYFYLLFYTLFSKLNIDFSKIHIILKDSYEEIIEEISKNSSDLFFLPEKRAQPYLNKFLFVERFPFKISHYFMTSSNNPFFHEIKRALFLVDKDILNLPGFEEIEEISSWEEEFIKNCSFISDIFPQMIEKCNILDTFLNAPFFGIAIYHDTFLYVNPYFCHLLGYTPEEFKKLAVWEVLYYEEDKERIKKVAERRLKGEFFFSPYQPIALKTRDGRKIETLIFASTIFYENKYCGFVIGVDITELKKLQIFLNLLRNINQILIACNYEDEIYEKILPIIYASLGLKGIWIRKNGQIINWYPKEFKPPSDLIFPIDEKSVYSMNISSYSVCVIPLIKDEEVIAFLNLLSDEPDFFIKEYVDLLKELQEDLNFALKKLELMEKDIILGKLTEKSEELVIIADSDGKVEYINPFGLELLGIKREDLVKENCFKLLYIPSEIINLKKDTTRFTIFNRPDKARILLELKISFIELFKKTKIVIIGKDLTKELEFEREREILQNNDPLTGLLNRRGFQKKVSDLLSILNKPSVLFMIDFYNFSYINHFYGFEVGDFCLNEMTKRFQNVLEDRGILGRTGGDEFSLFIIDIKEEGFMEWIKKLTSLLSEPLIYEDKRIFLDWNMGIVMFPQDGDTLDILWKKVNLILMEAKKKGPNTIEIYNTQIEKEIEKTFKIEILIKKAFEEDLFTFFYQPWFETETLKLAGAEALVRIKKKDQLILPGEFISTLEKSPYLSKFEFLCFKENIDKIKEWEIPISINISSQSFKTLGSLELLNYFKDSLSQYPYFLELEITEHTLAENIERAKKILESIKSFQVKIALDDFGIGYSSLNYLKDFPIDIIKIDISFIRNMVRDIKTYYIVENIINLAHLLNMKVVAEGVEMKEQIELLKKLKCDYVQGFLLSQPLSEKEIKNLIKRTKV